MTVKSSNTTIRDVALRAGVSVATVSRVLNNASVVTPVTVASVRSAISALHYVPRTAARNLATQRTNAIGLLLTEISGDFFVPLLNGVEIAASEAGFDLLISASANPGPRKTFPRSLGAHNTDGIILFTSSLEEKALADCYHTDFPMVLIHQMPPDTLNIPCVAIENQAASRQIVEHLIIYHNRRRIVFLKGPKGHDDSHKRQAGYLEALRAHHVPFAPELIAPGEFDQHTAKASIENLLAAGVTFDAVFAGDDEAAVGVLAALNKAGQHVPTDVSVVGFDDQRLSAYLTPPLTTVRAPTQQVGYQAVQQLLKLIRTGQADPLTLLPTELIIRRSCGCSG